MFLRDVRDLVSENAGELGFGLDEAKRAARDVHESAWRRERVDAVGVEHDERPRQLRSRCLLGEHGADERHVFVNGGVLDNAEPLTNLRADVLAELDLFGLRDVQVVELLLALLRLLRFLHEAAQLRESRAADGNGSDRE